jgi:hypothetical protein
MLQISIESDNPCVKKECPTVWKKQRGACSTAPGEAIQDTEFGYRAKKVSSFRI